ncbi:GntR family transcriptional regulator [Plantactinospora endophytica]|uniref:GntR family transcriptional regulator n=1 Tax=Plantactinospora endophytica TaxID=673535 RepID=A0ABQ4E6X5_9ACTN|nr:GntR family transcriptional regulator [Plantactinospora endophytica]GIG90443.1 GntR family transcriptional regulator [Plantactinospora endophytica]
MSTPKHVAITNALREQCRSLPVGSRLPSEKDLAARFEVSRMTVRQALDALAGDGRLERIPGSGTFVRRPTVAMGPNLTSFTEDMRSRGLRPSSRLVAIEEVAASPEVALDLGVEADTPVIRLERLRFADDEPMCLEDAHLPARFQRILDGADLEGSLHEVLAQAGVVVAAARRRVRAVPAPSRDAQLLGLPEHAPALEIVDVFYDGNRRPAQRSRSRYRHDRYEVKSDLHRPAEPRETDR